MNLTTIAAAIAFAIGLSAGGAGAWFWQASRVAAVQLELSHEQTDRANERISIQRTARATLERNMSAVSEAQAVAASRLAGLAADRDSAKSELGRLRIASDTAVRNASAGVDACTSTLATFNNVFAQCSSRLVEVGGDADQWASHAVMLQDAWPK